MLDAAMQARLRRVIPSRSRKFEVSAAVFAVSILFAASGASFFVGTFQASPPEISNKILMEAVVLATCEGQTPASVYLEATRTIGSERSKREEVLTFLIDRARNGTCGVLKDDSVEREFARRAPSDS